MGFSNHFSDTSSFCCITEVVISHSPAQCQLFYLFFGGEAVVQAVTPFLGWEGSPTKIDVQKKVGTLLLSSLLEDLVSFPDFPRLIFFVSLGFGCHFSVKLWLFLKMGFGTPLCWLKG